MPESGPRLLTLLTVVALALVLWGLIAGPGGWPLGRGADGHEEPPAAPTPPPADPHEQDLRDELLDCVGLVSDQARLSRARAGENTRLALEALARAARLAERPVPQEDTVEHPPLELTGAPVNLSATARKRRDVLDAVLEWEAPPRSDPPAETCRYEVWRWLGQGEPAQIATNLVETRFIDEGLWGAMGIGYVIYAVTPGRPFSTSDGRAVQVDLPPLHTLELVEPGLAVRRAPPSDDELAIPRRLTHEVAPGSAPPGDLAERVRIRIRRLADGTEESVTVERGEPVGTRIRTGHRVTDIRWVECRRPVRFLEPVFQSDGTVTTEGEEAKRRPRTLQLPVLLPEVTLVDGWGRPVLLRPLPDLGPRADLGPPRVLAPDGAGTPRGDR